MEQDRGRIDIRRRVLKSGVVFYGYFEAPDRTLRLAAKEPVVKSEDAARDRCREATVEAAKKAWSPESSVDEKAARMLFADYAEKVWLPSLQVAVKTKQGYLSTYTNHVKPKWGHRPLRSILKSEVLTWAVEMEQAMKHRKGGGAHTRRQALLIFGMIFNLASEDLGVRNVAKGVDMPVLPEHDVVIFTHEQWDKFYAALPEYWKPLCYVGVWTGLRPEELRALAPAHILWKAKQIRVSEALSQVSGKKNGGETMVRKETKGKRVRFVDFDHPSLPAKVGQVLAKEIMARGLSRDSIDPIFLMPNGKPFRQETLQDVFETACRVAGIPRRTPKDMRSTRASWLLKAHPDLMYVMKQLGHREVKTTEKYLTVVDRQEHDDDTSFEDFLAEEN